MGRGWASPWVSVQPKLKWAVLNAKTKAQMLRNSFLAMERGWASAWALVLTEAQITGFVIICYGNSLGFGLSFGSSDKTKAQMLKTSHFLQWEEVAPRLELRFNRSSNQRIRCYLQWKMGVSVARPLANDPSLLCPSDPGIFEWRNTNSTVVSNLAPNGEPEIYIFLTRVLGKFSA